MDLGRLRQQSRPLSTREQEKSSSETKSTPRHPSTVRKTPPSARQKRTSVHSRVLCSQHGDHPVDASKRYSVTFETALGSNREVYTDKRVSFMTEVKDSKSEAQRQRRRRSSKIAQGRLSMMGHPCTLPPLCPTLQSVEELDALHGTSLIRDDKLRHL